MHKARIHPSMIQRWKYESFGFAIYGRNMGLFKKLLTACLALLTLMFFFSVYAEAGIVFGTVSCEQCDLQKNNQLLVYNANDQPYPSGKSQKRISIENGRYKTFLDQGFYKIRWYQRPDCMRRPDNPDCFFWEGWIQSFPSSVKQDIILKRKSQ